MTAQRRMDQEEVALFVASGRITRWRPQADPPWRKLDDWIDAWKAERQRFEARWLDEGKFDDR